MKAIDDLLTESVEHAKARESSTFDQIAAGLPIVLFGAGGLGRRTVRGLRQLGVHPIAFCDNNNALWGAQVEGLPVHSLAEAAERYGNTAVFVISIWGALSADRMPEREQQLKAAGCRTVVNWGPLYWKYPTLFPHYAANAAHCVLGQSEAVRKCAELWADDYSKDEFLRQVRWRLFFDFAGLSDPVGGPMYFREELRPIATDEVFIDCGAFDGDTVLSFLDVTGRQFQHVYCYEPDPANFSKLKSVVMSQSEHDRFTIKQAAVGSRDCNLKFSGEGNASSAVGAGDLEVHCIKLDDELAAEKPTIIKMDIEGFEPEALAGAKNIIEREKPLLAISSYHAQDHLWKIPLQIREYNPDYRFYLRPHMRDVWDLVCYAVPS